MRNCLIALLAIGLLSSASAQSSKIELYDLLKKFFYDSTGYENVGDWAVGQPKKFPVKWKADQVNMSDDTSINFFRQGTADITINGKSFIQAGQPVKWNVMLKGPRMGYTSFAIVSSASSNMNTNYNLDSVFGKRPFKAKLIKSCDSRKEFGYYFYEVKLPKKDVAYLKLSWISVNGNTALRIDGYDGWSKQSAKLACP
ncbi:MAG: hypothetical protein WCF67_00390 [Chitinophagaceae bacterium]